MPTADRTVRIALDWLVTAIMGRDLVAVGRRDAPPAPELVTAPETGAQDVLDVVTPDEVGAQFVMPPVAVPDFVVPDVARTVTPSPMSDDPSSSPATFDPSTLREPHPSFPLHFGFEEPHPSGSALSSLSTGRHAAIDSARR